MNFYVDSGGVIIAVDSERIFQGSANANTVRFIGAFPMGASVLVSYTLPDGTSTVGQLMTLKKELSGLQSNGVTYSLWEQKLGVKYVDGKWVPDYTIFAQAGKVAVHFTVTQADSGGSVTVLATASSSFIVEKGKAPVMPFEAYDEYESLLNQILSRIAVSASDIAANTSRIAEVKSEVESNEGLIESLAKDIITPQGERIGKLEDTVEEHETFLQNQGAGLSLLEIKANEMSANVAQNTSDIEGLRLDMQNESHFHGYVPDNTIFETLVGDINDYAYSTDDGFIWVHNGEGWEKTDRKMPDKATPLGDSTPLMDGEASPGISTNAAREDHRHKTDTTRASAKDLETLSKKVNGLSAGGNTESPTVLTVDLSKIATLTISFAEQQPNATKIDWGDGEVTTDFATLPSHDYAEVGTYEIRIYGATELKGMDCITETGCWKALTQAVIGNSVTVIADNAFYECGNLKILTTSDSLETIGNYAFMFCENLAKVVFGRGLKNVGYSAFLYTGLVLLQSNAIEPPTIAATSFIGSLPVSFGVLVPRESVESYRSAENWTSLAAMITANAWLSDLDDYVKVADIGSGLRKASDGKINVLGATMVQIDLGASSTTPLTTNNIRYAVKVGLTTNTETLTDDEKTSACEWLGARQIYEPTANNTAYLYQVRRLADGTIEQGVRRTSATRSADAVPIYGTNGSLQVGEPTGGLQSYHATSREWVENMPDKVTLTDEQKAKWRAMLGIE